MGAAEDISVKLRRVLVTGGGGFVGRAIVSRLLTAGCAVTVLGRSRYPDLSAQGIRCVRGDITDRAAVATAIEGAQLVFHTAAKAGISGARSDYYAANVIGTRVVLAACRNADVPLVYTSTPSVVFAGEDIAGGDETLPHAAHFLCHYAETKSIAEKEVLAAAAEIPVCAIRPHLVWGPGDPHLLPRLVAAHRNGRLRRVGDGTNLVDISYIDNVAEAHLCAGAVLVDGGECAARGRAYFIGQSEPVNLWDWVNELFVALGLAPVERSLSFPAAVRLGRAAEKICALLATVGFDREPRMTPFVAEQLARSHWFSHAAAERDLGWSARVSTEDGLKRTIPWLHDKLF